VPIAGLEGIVAGNSALSAIDGAAGRLGYRGIPIEELSEKGSFEECVYLLWYDALPNKKQLADFSKELIENRPLPSGVWDVLKPIAGKQSLMDLVRTGVSALSAWDKDILVTLDDPAEHAAANLRMSKRLTAKMATLVAGAYRLSKGQQRSRPRPTAATPPTSCTWSTARRRRPARSASSTRRSRCTPTTVSTPRPSRPA
jgi:citrate synthase